MSQIKRYFQTDQYKAIYTVEDSHEGMRLDSFIQQFYPNFSREELKKRIKEQMITISDRPVPHRPSTKVHKAEIVTIMIPRQSQEDEYWNGEKIDIQETPEILFEDKDLIVISKPPFMTTHPTGKHIYNCATVYFEQKIGHTIHSIHRLDRETSGVMLLAKNPTFANQATSLFENGKVQKCYFFISKFLPEMSPIDQTEFCCDHRLAAKDKGEVKRVYIEHYPPDSKMGKKALTSFKILYKDKKYAMGLAFPKTGRQHQIRVHAMVNGYPLLGDKLYLGGYPLFQRFKDLIPMKEDHDLMEIPRHALHALAIKIPLASQSFFQDHLPLDFKDWMSKQLPKVCLADFEATLAKEINLWAINPEI